MARSRVLVSEVASDTRWVNEKRPHRADVRKRPRSNSLPDQLIIADRNLPHVNGLIIVQALRAAGSTVPVLVLSALGSVDDRIEGLRAGGDDYLIKPFSLSELGARVRALIRRAAGQTGRSWHKGR